MGNCYIFNPANGVLEVTLNNVYLGPVAPATAGDGYAPQSIVTSTARHDDGAGYLAIADPNTLSVYYRDDPKQQFGPYVVQLYLSGRNVSVDDDVIIYAGRPPAAGLPSVVTMTPRGFVIDTRQSTRDSSACDLS
jgi:hypothetical protein